MKSVVTVRGSDCLVVYLQMDLFNALRDLSGPRCSVCV